MKYKVLILNDGSDYKNWGIIACIDGLKIIFKNFKTDTISHYEMHKRYINTPKFFGYRWFSDENPIFNKIFNNYNILPKTSNEIDEVSRLWREGKGGKGAKSLIRKIQYFKPDLVVFNAEGSTYKNNIGSIKGLFVLHYISTFYPEIKTAFINGSVTITSVDNTLGGIIRKTFSKINFVSVREIFSFENLIEYYPELSNTRLILDSAFLNPKIHHSKKVDRFLESYSINSFGAFSLSMLPFGSIELLKQFLFSLFSDKEKVILLAKDVEDIQRIKPLLDYSSKFILVPDSFDYQDIEYLLSKCDLLVSGRYHHLIFAIKNRCPILPLNTSSHKIKGLVRSIFKNPLIIDITDLERYSKKNLQDLVKLKLVLEEEEINEIQSIISKSYSEWLDPLFP